MRHSSLRSGVPSRILRFVIFTALIELAVTALVLNQSAHSDRRAEARDSVAFASIPQKGGGRTGSISANPNPIQVCDGTGLGSTTLTWTSTGTTTVEVHMGSP